MDSIHKNRIYFIEWKGVLRSARREKEKKGRMSSNIRDQEIYILAKKASNVDIKHIRFQQVKSIPGRGKSRHSRNSKYKIAFHRTYMMDSSKKLDWKTWLETNKWTTTTKTNRDLNDKVSNLVLFLIHKGKALEGFQSHWEIYHWKANHQMVLEEYCGLNKVETGRTVRTVRTLSKQSSQEIRAWAGIEGRKKTDTRHAATSSLIIYLVLSVSKP